MSHIMTVTLPDGEEVEVNITRIISKQMEFYCFEGRERRSGQPVEVRVETKENYDDRKSRGC